MQILKQYNNMKSTNITREEMWAKQHLSIHDIDYAVWERDKSILHQLSKICHNCTFVVDVYKCNYTYASSNFVDLLGYDSHKIETLEKQGDYRSRQASSFTVCLSNSETTIPTFTVSVYSMPSSNIYVSLADIKFWNKTVTAKHGS